MFFFFGHYVLCFVKFCRVLSRIGGLVFDLGVQFHPWELKVLFSGVTWLHNSALSFNKHAIEIVQCNEQLWSALL